MLVVATVTSRPSHDPVVVPDSSNTLAELLAHVPVDPRMIDSGRHGILNEDIGDTRAAAVASLDAWARPEAENRLLS